MNANMQSGTKDLIEGSETSPADTVRPTCDDDFDELKDSDARLWHIVDMLFDGFLIIRDDVVIQANQGLLSMTGYHSSELVGHRIEDLDGWQDLGRSLTSVSDELVTFESVVPRKNSLPVTASVRARRISRTDHEDVIAIVAGMTEGEPASASLLRSAERYRSLFEAIPDLVFIKDKSLRYSEINPAMEKTLRLSAAEFLGRRAEQIYGEEAGGRIRAWDLRVLSGEIIEEEHTLSVKSENLVLHEVRVPIRSSSGEVIGVCGIARDVTERRAAMGRPGVARSGYSSKAMKETTDLARQAAATDSIVLLLGESGSGKDHLARWIHEHSRRSGSPFLTINCAAVPHDLAESELFGHESGAFTGARSRKKGLLELAEGGTLLLNEIAELSLPLQSKLLVFLDSRSFRRLGGQKSVHVDARILAATHRSLDAEVEAGRFLSALYYRLNVLQIRVPPLRERIDDIPQLSRELIAKVAAEMNLSRIPLLDPESLKGLMRHNWPGNVRELRNVLEKGLIMWQSGKLKLAVPVSAPQRDDLALGIPVQPGKTLKKMSAEFEKMVCVEAIQRNGGNRTAAARSLGISRDSLYRHLKSGTDPRGTPEETTP